MVTTIAKNIKSKEDFLNYLESLDLFRVRLWESDNSFYAELSSTCKPNLDNFTQISKIDGRFIVRLSKKDIK